MSGVPPVASAVPGFDLTSWNGIFGPAGMPSAIVNRLYAEIRKALQEPKLVAFFREGGFEPRADAPAEFAKIFRADIKRYGDIVKAAKIEPE